MAETTRRRFLSAGVAAGTGLWIARNRVSAQGLGGQFAMPGQPPCTDTRKATPEVKNLEAFKPNAPERTLIAEGGIAGVLLAFSGTVIGLTCGVIKGARVDVWHADIRGEYDMKGFNHRGAQKTDDKGAFGFQTTPPGAAAALPPHINVRIQPPGKTPFTTRVFLGDGGTASKDPAVPAELVAKVEQQNGKRTATFNFVLNL
jgi:protocatechuate 3,4-dioxygenase beta subunit